MFILLLRPKVTHYLYIMLKNVGKKQKIRMKWHVRSSKTDHELHELHESTRTCGDKYTYFRQ